jgi:hypothetical protein
MSRDSCQLCPGIRYRQPDHSLRRWRAASGRFGAAFLIPAEGNLELLDESVTASMLCVNGDGTIHTSPVRVNRCGCPGRIEALPSEGEQLARKPVGVNTDYPGCDGGGDHGRGSRAPESAPTGSGGLALSRCSTVVKTSSVSPMFSMSWSRYSPGPKWKCLV